MPYEQCQDCGRSFLREELYEVGFDDDGCGGIIADYICSPCHEARQLNDFHLEQFQEEEGNNLL